MKDLSELRRQKGNFITQGRAIIEKAETEKRRLTAEEDANFKTAMKEADQIDCEIKAEEQALEKDRERRELLEAREKEARLPPVQPARPDPDAGGGQGGVTEEVRALALQAWALTQQGIEVQKRHVEAVKAVDQEFRTQAMQRGWDNVPGRQVGFDTRRKEIEFLLRFDYRKVKREFRDLSVSSGAAGAFTIPEGFVPNLEIALLQFGGMRAVADVMRTDTGNPLPWPTTDDTSNEGEIVGENADFGASVDPKFGAVVFNAYKYSSKPVLVPFELLQDNAVNLANVLGTMIGDRIGRIQNKHFTTGDAGAKPKGIVTASTLGITAASATAVTADELLQLVHKVDPAYRPGATWMMHDDILLEVRKLKDGNGQYLWQPGLMQNMPNLLYGYLYVVNQSMDSTIAAGKKTFLFGQLSKYKLRDVATIRLKRLDERYAEKDQVAFIAFMRSDGNLLDAGVAPVKHLKH